jgi:hypothetical protein
MVDTRVAQPSLRMKEGFGGGDFGCFRVDFLADAEL